MLTKTFVRSMLGAAVVIAPLWAAPAAADESQAAAAQALFDEAKRLMDASSYAEACPKLAESQRLDPAGGTLLLLAMCHEAEGKTASAWAEFAEAETQARRDARPDREAAAAARIRALEPRLTKLRVQVASEAPGLEVSRDGVAVGKAQWSVPLPVDPGAHTIEAHAPGKRAWQEVVEAKGEGGVVTVEVPALAEEPRAAAPKPRPRRAPVAPARPVDEPTGVSQRTWAFIGGGAGVVLLGVGAGFGLAASSKWSTVKSECPSLRCTTPAQANDAEAASRSADVATGFLLAGGVVVAVSAVLFATAPSDKPTVGKLRWSPTASRDGFGLGVSGAL